MNQPLLQVKNLSVILDDKKVIHDVSFDIRPEEVVAVIGPNGAGKSVLLKTLLGLVSKSGGEIIWAPSPRIGYLPQRFQVDAYLPMTVKEFWCLRCRPDLKPEKAIGLVGLKESFLGRGLSHLSGGELQRVLLAWSLLNNPQILLFDEPTENVDVVGQESIYTLLHHLQDTLRVAMIIISHDLHVVYRYANVVICLNKKMLCEGAPREVLTTAKLGELYGDHAFFHHHHTDHRSHD